MGAPPRCRLRVQVPAHKCLPIIGGRPAGQGRVTPLTTQSEIPRVNYLTWYPANDEIISNDTQLKYMQMLGGKAIVL